MNSRIEEIRARCDRATPGPWKWDLRTATRQCKLITDHSGQYYVMDFERWGMQGACPSLQVYDKYTGPVTERGSRGMVRVDKMAKSYPGKEHHRGFDGYIDHPDALFIAHAREDIPFLLSLLAASQARERAAMEERDMLMRRHSKQVEVVRRRIDTGGLTPEEQRLLDDLVLPRHYDRRGPEAGEA